MNFDLDKEFAALLPKLTDDEHQRLKDSITIDDLDIPLIVASVKGKRLLIDGYNRLPIYRELKRQFRITTINLASRELCVQWIINHQLSRRNLTDEARDYFIGKKYLAEKGAHGDKSRFDDSPSGNFCHLEKTAEKVASDHEISPRTVRNNAAFSEAVDQIGETAPDAKAAILAGKSNETKQGIIDRASSRLCPRCARVGPVRDCPDCKHAAKPQTPTAEPSPFDADVAATVALFTEMDTLTARLQKLIDQASKQRGGEALRMTLTPTTTGNNVINRSKLLNDLKRDLRFSRPHKPCSRCKGKLNKNCRLCSGYGWITEITHKNSPEELTA